MNSIWELKETIVGKTQKISQTLVERTSKTLKICNNLWVLLLDMQTCTIQIEIKE